ncbi:DMT family transporter [Halalkalibacter oceani]|uniref:DMT family transporter n=1 Tax=Halalkalibacter oceani TaxID=1653776 RepID=UPI003398C533
MRLTHPYLLLTLAMVFFSGNFIVGKAFAGEVPPFTLAWARFLIGTVVLLPLCYKTLIRNRQLWLDKWLPLTGIAFFGVFLFNVALYVSVHYTTTINASIVDALTPAVAAVLGYFFLKERLTLIQSSGVILSFCGILLLLSGGSLAVLRSLSFNIGDLIMLAGIICWAIYSILIKLYGHEYPVIAGLVMTFIIGVLMLFPFVLYEWRAGLPFSFKLATIGAFLYVGIFPGALALLCWYRGVAAIGPSKASIFFNLVPVFTTLFAIVLLGESAGWFQLFGGTIVLGGVYLSTIQPKKEEASDLVT